MNEIELLEDLPEILSWLGKDDAEERLFSNHGQAMIQHCATALSVDLGHRFEQLDTNARRRLATAPSTYHELTRSEVDAEARRDQFAGAITAEELRAGLRTTAPRQVWTALGDTRCAPTGDIELAPSSLLGIPVDFDSPHARCQPPMHTDEEVPAGTRQHVLAQIDEACRVLLSRSGRASEFIRRSIRVICPRIRTDGRVGLGSSSWSDEIGKCVITYPRGGFDQPDLIASCLLHEAVHSFLYVIERSCETYYQPKSELRLRSPWTGRALPVSSATHACFVWYALTQFWSLPGVSSNEAQLEFASAGFESEHWHPFVTRLHHHVSPPVGRALFAIATRVS